MSKCRISLEGELTDEIKIDTSLIPEHVRSVVIHIVSFLPVVPIGQPVMQLQLGVVVFQLDLDDDFFAAHGNIGDFGFQNSRHRLRWDFV